MDIAHLLEKLIRFELLSCKALLMVRICQNKVIELSMYKNRVIVHTFNK